jgi:hypothetical protein
MNITSINYDPEFQGNISGYPEGALVFHGGSHWVSLIDNNMSEPGTDVGEGEWEEDGDDEG